MKVPRRTPQALFQRYDRNKRDCHLSVLLQRLLEDCFHRLFHTRLFRQVHVVDGHHSSARRRDTEVQLTIVNLAVIAAISSAEYFLGFSSHLIVVGAVSNLLSCWFAFWVHRACHAPTSILDRFHWFQHLCVLHGTHHKDASSNVNFSIFYPFWFDRIFRTYSPK
jgi:sterol desaturase/sphingolipid hydroxylase (fatty acid hydroxylase superfamily)